MRAVFGVLSLLLVVAVIGLLAKKQMKSVTEIQVPALPASAAATKAIDGWPSLEYCIESL